MEYKRVACLYRVSTTKQVEKDDIPMQKIACREYIATKPNWKLEKEYAEKGVSGYKKKAEERDVFQQVKIDAKNKVFDVLLVFMFDRLGRREDETPFIVEWFVKQGIEVWSTREGEQRFDTRVDKLLNYIRFWQAGGESEKTGIRVKERQSQLAREGIYMSATPPYGYTLVKSGVYSRKGIERKMLKVLPEEAEIVRLVYSLCADKGYGGRRIARLLNERNIPSKKGGEWTLSVINYMLRNPVYKGYIAYNKTSVKKNGTQGRVGSKDWILAENKSEEIAIVDEEIWNKVQRIRLAKTPERYKEENMDYESYPLTTKSIGLLTGIVRCGYCGSKLNLGGGRKKYVRMDGGVTEGKKYWYYKCVGNSAGKLECEHKKHNHKKEDVEKPVLEAINIFFNTLQEVDLKEEIEKIKNDNIQEDTNILKAAIKEIEKKKNEIVKIKEEVVKALMGESSFSKEMLSEMLQAKTKELEMLNENKTKLEDKINRKKIKQKDIKLLSKTIPNWKEEFELACVEEKKMLINQIIKDVEVFENEIKIKMKIDFEDFLSKTIFRQNVHKSGHSRLHGQNCTRDVLKNRR